MHHTGGLDLIELRQCPWLSHEFAITNVWRFYYSFFPAFYEGAKWRNHDIGGKNGVASFFSRFLRSAVFIHVVLPSVIRDVEQISAEVEKAYGQLWGERRRLLRRFSNQELSDLLSAIGSSELIVGKAQESGRRLNEIRRGIRNTLDYIELQDPWRSNLQNAAEFFHLHETRNANPRYLSDLPFLRYQDDELRQKGDALDIGLDKLQRTAESATEFVESRKGIIEDRLNVARSIVFAAQSGLRGLLTGGLLWLWVLKTRMDF
jgi:hypothetical protein